MAHHDEVTQTVTLIVDIIIIIIITTTTADAAVHAITGSAMDREARIRRAKQASKDFPKAAMAEATARLSPHAKQEPPPASEPSSALTASPSSPSRAGTGAQATPAFRRQALRP